MGQRNGQQTQKADRVFYRAMHMLAARSYGPNLGLPVSAPDHRKLAASGANADCEGEFARVGDAFPKCGEWFSLLLGRRPRDTPGGHAIVFPALAGMCHNPSNIYAMIYGPW